jgi:transcriptional regulator with XRE-family HTH domain
VKSPEGKGESEIAALGMGDRVKAARDRLRWSRETLAHRSGLSWSAIEQIESGRRRRARPDTLRALARALGVTIDYLLDGGSAPGMLRHQVLLYEDEPGFLAAIAPFLLEGAERSEAALAVTSGRNIEILRQKLGSAADRIEFVDAEQWYRTPASALDAYRGFLDKRLEGCAWARIVGEPVWAGRSEEEVRVWNHYESLLNLVLAPLPVTVLCPYDVRSVDPGIAAAARLTHPEIVDGDHAAENPMYQDPGDFVLGHPGPGW